MSVGGCQAPAGGVSVDGVDLTKESVVQGVVTRSDGTVEPTAYVRLLDSSGEFAAEVATNDAGEFRFFAAPGAWTVRTLAPRAKPLDLPVEARRGVVADVRVTLPS
ncbi:MAG: DUF1416 domain-containing protein [Jiangellaceae bacterium]|nr:DUF1416 domain-containing protein [Jiangellaceae bacterium]